MPEKRCSRCGEDIIYSADDIRPHLYHECRDLPEGQSAQTRNPNYWEKEVMRKYIPTNRKRKHTLWQEFG